MHQELCHPAKPQAQAPRETERVQSWYKASLSAKWQPLVRQVVYAVAISSQLVVDASGLLNLGLELDLASTKLPQTLHALKGGERLVVWPSDVDLHHRLHAILRHGEMRESGVSCIPRGVSIADGTRVLEGGSRMNPDVPNTCSPWFYHLAAELHIHEDTHPFWISLHR